MQSGPPRSVPARSVAPDPYGELLRDTRGLRREQQNARDAWFYKLELDQKEDYLFELEILLKGLACFANPRNHPGPPRRTAIVAQDYKEPLVLVRDGIGKIVGLTRNLLAEHDKAFVFQRYLETLLPDDGARTKLVKAAITQDTPEESLFVMRHGMTYLLEVVNGTSRLPRVPFRLFFALMSVAHREVSQSAFFNPLSALEFRPEFDRITNPRVLELMRQVPGEQGRRLVALTFLSLFRMLRYLSLIEQVARERRGIGIVYLVLSVLRSDARALTGHLRQRAGAHLADSYERELFKVPASQMAERYDSLLLEGHRLIGIKGTLGGISANLRLEMRRAFEHDFPSPITAPTPEQLRTAATHVAANLRPAIQNAILVLGKSLGARLDEQGLFDDLASKRALSERLRRDVWMFSQIVRAFGVKATAAESGEERWTGASSIQFVREFLSYFNAMGYPLLRSADYPRIDPFLSALSALSESDLLDPQRLEHAIHEAENFYVFLTELFERIGHRDELKDITFDRRAAAGALKLYLGD